MYKSVRLIYPAVILVSLALLHSHGRAQRCSDELRFGVLDSILGSTIVPFAYDSILANNTYELKWRYYDRLRSRTMTASDGIRLTFEVRVDQIIKSRGADSVESYIFDKPYAEDVPAEFSTGCGGVFRISIVRRVFGPRDLAAHRVDTMSIRFDLQESPFSILIPYIPGDHVVATGRDHYYAIDSNLAGVIRPTVKAQLAEYYERDLLFGSYDITPNVWHERLERWFRHSERGKAKPQDR